MNSQLKILCILMLLFFLNFSQELKQGYNYQAVMHYLKNLQIYRVRKNFLTVFPHIDIYTIFLITTGCLSQNITIIYLIVIIVTIQIITVKYKINCRKKCMEEKFKRMTAKFFSNS